MGQKIESGISGDIQNTHKQFKDSIGNAHNEVKQVDKTTGEVTSHILDGKEMEEKKSESKNIQYNPGNGEYFSILNMQNQLALLQLISNQLKEINYYLVKGFGDKSDQERIDKLLHNG